MKGHIVVVGYGTTGRGAIEALRAEDPTNEFVVIDPLPAAVAAATDHGVVAIEADATHTAAWASARVDVARAVVITCNRDDTATLVTLTVRQLNSRVPISVTIRQAENGHLLRQSGANTVVLSSEAAGRLVGLSTTAPGAVAVLEDLLTAGTGLDLLERTVDADEVGGAPDPTRGVGLPIALIRKGARVSFDEPAFQHVEPGDVVVSVTGRR